MRPVDAKFPVSQDFGSFATAGVAADPNGNAVQQLVAQYGNYQPYGHAGQDIACPIGTPVRAIAGGTVLWADWGTNLPGDDSWSSSGYFRRWALYKTFPGIVTVIQHDGWISVYAHLSDAPLNAGDRVTEGQIIARSGNTRSPGVALAAHLHVEALVDLSYSTGGGLIYGRTDPTPFYGGAAIAPQSTTITKEDTLSAAEADRIIAAVNGYTAALLIYGYNSGGKKHPGVAAVVEENQRRIGAVPAQVWAQTATDPNNTKHAPRVVDWLVYGNLKAGRAADALAAMPAAVAPAIDVQALAAQLAPLLTTAQAHEFVVALGTALTKE